MRVLGLLFSMLLLAVAGMWLVLTFSLLAFHWSNVAFFLIIAGIVYGLVRWIGGSLDRKFNSSVREFLDGKTGQLVPGRGLVATFGLLLITLLPFLLYLLVLALYAAVAFVLYSAYGIAQLPRIPIAVIIGLAIVLFGSAIAFLVGLFRLFFPPKKKSFGISIGKDEHKDMWKLTDEVAKALGTRCIDKIVVTPDAGIGVYLEGSFLRTVFGGGRRVLELGVPSVHNLPIREFKAVLAHEYGHFGNRDTQWSTFTYSMGNSLISAFQATPGPVKSKEGEEGGIIQFIMALNPAHWILRIFVALYFRITNGFSRIGEVMADIRAMKLYGGENFRNGLLRVSVNDWIFGEIVQGRWVKESLKEGKTLINFSSVMNIIYEGMEKDTIEGLQSDLLAAQQANDIYDSHPGLGTRIAYSQRFQESGSSAGNGETVSTLFDGWDKLAESVTDLYNLRLMALLKSAGAWAPEERTEQQATEAAKEQQSA